MTTSAPRASTRQWAALSVLTLAVVMLAIDATVLALAVPALTADLEPTSTQVLWIGDVYSFALAGLLVTAGNVADRVGRKKLLLLGSVGFGIASVLAALSPSAEVLIAARILLGISGATIMPSTLSLIRNIFEDPAQRARAIAVWAAGTTGGAALGPLVGGLLLEHFTWGSVFLINVPVVILIVGAGIVLLPESRHPGVAPIDLVSAGLSILAIVPVVYAVKHAVGTGIDWSVPVTAAIGLSAGWLFIRRQRRLPQPLIDVALFRIPAFTGSIAGNTLAVFAFSGLLFFFSQYLQLVRGFSPLQAGLAELPAALSTIGVIFVVGVVLRRLGQGRAIALGLSIAGAGLVLLAFAEGWTSFLGIVVAFAVIGLGVGLTMTLSADAVLGSVPKERSGAASSISETGYELGVALGIAVLGSLQTALYRGFLNVPQGTPEAVATTVRESLPSAQAALEGEPGDAAALLEAAREAFTHGMQVNSFVAAGLLLVAAVTTFTVIPSARSDDTDVPAPARELT